MDWSIRMSKRKHRQQGKGSAIRQGSSFKKYGEGFKRIFGDRTPTWTRAKVCPACKGMGCNKCDDGMIYTEGRLT